MLWSWIQLSSFLSEFSEFTVSSTHSIACNGLNLQVFIRHYFKKLVLLCNRAVSSRKLGPYLTLNFVCFFFMYFIFKTFHFPLRV